MATSDGRVAAEVEIKLEATSPQQLSDIAGLDAIAGYRLRSRRIERLRTIYLDTADFAMVRSGVAVRLRRGPDGWLATVKWAGRVAGSLHERPELNVPLPRRPRFPFTLPAGPLRTQLAATVLERPLSPILISDVQRHVLDLLPARGRATAKPVAEVALDIVQLRAPDEQPLGAAYCEVEIEQRAGSRDDLIAASRDLQERFGLIPSHASKFARGLGALHQAGARPRAADPIRPGDALASAARAILAGLLGRLRAADPATRVGADPEALHDMRVAVRRLRAAMRAFSRTMPTRTHDRLTRELHWLGRELGAVRDLDVQLANLDWHRARLEPELQPLLQPLLRHTRRERERHREALLAALDSPRYRRLLLQLEQFALGQVPRRPRGAAAEPIAEVGARAIRKASRRLVARGDAIGDLPRAADLHALRIRAKRLRYLLEALKPLSGEPGRKLTKHLIRLQDLLGRFNDAIVAARWIRAYERGGTSDVDADVRYLLEALADTELQRAGAAQADFRRAWRRFTSGRVRKLRKAVLSELAAEVAPPPAGTGSGTV